MSELVSAPITQAAAGQAIGQAAAPAPQPAQPAAFLNIGAMIQNTVRSELAALKLAGVTTEHKVGAAVLKYWPVGGGVVVAIVEHFLKL